MFDASPPLDGPPRLFAMVTTAKSCGYTPYAISSFFDTTRLRPQDRFVLINNDDPTLHERIAPHRNAIEVVTNAAPKGFAANANSMISEALRSGMDLFFMNNDIIFTDHWLTPLTGEPHSILSPISNREVQYAGSAIVTKTQQVANLVVTEAPMALEQYLAAPRMYQAIAEGHRKLASGMMRLVVFPFFCVRIPLEVMRRVGKFDEAFGRAGGEDYDYCLRAWLAGFNVQMVLSSYLLHFWGKSTWGVKDGQQAASYNTDFLEIFRAKWGEALFQYTLQENDSCVKANPQATSLRDRGDLAGVVRLLMDRPVEIHMP
jgi:GT2 family glycosyltransferase